MSCMTIFFWNRTIRPGFLAGNSVFWRETPSVNIVSIASYKMNHNAADKETNVVHFSHCYRLNFYKPYDTLFVEVVQLKVV